MVSGGTGSSRVCLATRCSWCSSGKVLEAAPPFPFPIFDVFSVYRGFGRCAVVSLATRNVGLVALCGPRELDSVARKWTDFELLCSTPLRNVSKSFILGLASEYVLRVHGRSVYLSEVEVRRYSHCGTSITSCLVCTVCSKVIHVVWCCTEVLRPWVQFGTGICVCRSLQSFGEATRLPRMPVACRSVPVRRFCVGISQ